MNTPIETAAQPSPAHEAAAALHAVSDQAISENLAVIADLSDTTHDTHVAEHIRAMVAVTMGHLSGAASTVTRDHAERWQAWALGVAGGTVRPLR